MQPPMPPPPPEQDTSSDEEEAVEVLDLRHRGLAALPELPLSLLALRCGDNAMAALPQGIAQLEDLRALDVSRNRLRSLPAVLPRKLEILAAAENALAELPEALPAGLRSLGLAHNDLACLALPPLAHLESLAVGGNRLAALPPAIGRLKTLTSLLAYDNDLDELPPEIGDLPRLSVLKVGGNRLTHFPEALERCAALRELHAYGNRLVAAAPADRLSHLKRLWLGANRLAAFDGAGLGGLEVLDLERNERLRALSLPPRAAELRLYGLVALAAAPVAPPTCATLVLGGCGFVEPPRLPARLVSLRLESNGLAALPKGLVAPLERLHASANRLTALPDELCDVATLKVLDVAANHIVELPADLGRLARLERLFVDRNALRALPRKLSKTLVELRCYGNPKLRETRWPAIRTIYADRRAGQRRRPAGTFLDGVHDPALPYANLLVARGHARCVVAFGAMGLEWAGTLARARVAADVCLLYDDAQTSYGRAPAALRAFLAKLRTTYAAVSFLGSSRGAYGALRYADLATADVVALSPLRADIRWRDDDDALESFPTDTVAARVRVHVGARNRRDVAVAERIRAAHLPGAEIVAVAASAGHGPDLYAPPSSRLDALVGAELFS
ncbi:hypothetical protein SO694_00023444 [Aureococcus anophagefferens]|uniref:Uncharacterized protein n=1 Tax=Aureococcus anophagefferens TaxID=44056 RepID=A0ABR1FTT9_AURAN